MKPRVFSMCALAGALLWCATSPRAGAAEAKAVRPNILLINADDHRADGIRALGNPAVQTPNLDRLVERGFVFRNAYTMGSLNTGAVCLPSRTQLLTALSVVRATPIQFAGRKPAVEEPKDPALDPGRFLAGVFAKAGYETMHAGKPGNEFRAGIAAFEKNFESADSEIPQRRLSSRRHTDAVLEFLRSRKTERPFLIYLAPPVPHDPRVAEEQFHKLYDPEKIPLPVNYLPQHPFDNGDMKVRDEKLLPWPRTKAAVQKELADYCACITGLDYHLGRVFDHLKQSGELDNTVVVFCGDNGLSMGEHGLLGKQNLYEFGGMHVPLVIAGPGISHGESKAFVYHMDLMPTLCEMTGAVCPAGVDGKSFAPILRGETRKVRDYALTTYLKCQRAVRDDRWKLIRYPLIDKSQLFDLNSDPRELKDLAGDPAMGGKLQEMTALLARAQKDYGDTAPLTVPDPKPSTWSP